MSAHNDTDDTEAKGRIDKAKSRGWKIELHNNGLFDLLTPDGGRIGRLNSLTHLSPAELEALAWKYLLVEAATDAKIEKMLFS
jgi:hypothetical protein